LPVETRPFVLICCGNIPFRSFCTHVEIARASEIDHPALWALLLARRRIYNATFSLMTLPSKKSDSVLYTFLERTGGLGAFIGRFFAQCWRRPFEGRELIHQMDEVGSKSFLLIAVMGFSIGLVVPMQSRGSFAHFGMEHLLPDMVSLSMFKELGPVLTAVLLAGRVGAGMGAEIGSMRISEQIDALEVAALKPFHYLVVTRVLACMLMFPMLTIVADAFGLAGAFLEGSLVANMDYRVFLKVAFQTVRFVDIIVDTGKTMVFGFLVGIVSCYLGYTVRGGTREVGQAAMQSVVLSSLLILLADVIIVRTSIMLFGGVETGG
jgi:phospholipid/cholesterol/gamma-HCH transport system permease protein